jgi:1-acyl-sn-glycerol-3-phosphate acyltransferase
MATHPLYWTLAHPTRWFLRATARIEVEGLDNVPMKGPFLILPNHQSVVDPFLVQSCCPRSVHSMTKSTQFGVPGVRWLLPRIGAFPVRRYQVDPQCVRVALRLLDRGEGVCIYPEGERSWDGSIYPFRRGTLHLALRAGVPIVPVGVGGTFQYWPRWLALPQPGARIRLAFGRPLQFEAITDREEREARLPGFERLLATRLRDLSGSPLSVQLQERISSTISGSSTRR